MRKPDLTIGPISDPRTLRWHLPLPGFLKRRGWQLAFHKWIRSDDDRALHDHRSWSLSLILTGGYWEVTPNSTKWYGPGSIILRPASLPHRVLLADGSKPIYTLWLRGRHQRDWGFHCAKGWRPASEYLANTTADGKPLSGVSIVGRGCD